MKLLLLITIVLAAAVCWLAADRHSAIAKLAEVEKRAAKAEESEKLHHGKYNWALTELNKFNPKLAQAIANMDADLLKSLKEKPVAKTWLQERIEGHRSVLDAPATQTYSPAFNYNPNPRPTTSGSRIIR